MYGKENKQTILTRSRCHQHCISWTASHSESTSPSCQ